MKTILVTPILSLFIGFSAFGGELETAFLKRLGFEPLSAQIKQSLATPNLSSVSKIALSENLEKYKILDEARDLSTFIFDQVVTDLDQKNIQDKVARIAVHLLRPGIETIQIPIPTYFKESYHDEDFQRETKKYKENTLTENRNKELLYLVALTSEVIHDSTARERSGLDFKKMQSSLAQKYKSYLAYKANYPDIAGTNYLGRALVALLVRHSRLQNQPTLESKIQYYLTVQSDSLGNYIRDEFTFTNRAGNKVTISLKSGDFVHKYAADAEAYLISAGVVPGSSANEGLADRLGLVNSLNDILKFPTPDKEKKIQEKLSKNIPLSEDEERLYLQTKISSTGLGFSHVGLVEVKRDLKTNIAMSWVWDVYPTGGLAGARFIGLEGFAPPDKSQKIGFSRYSSSAFMAYYKNRKSKEGYLTDVWKTFRASVLNNGQRVNQTKDRAQIKSFIGDEEYLYLMSFQPNQAHQWYSEEIVPRVLNQMKRHLVSEQAVLFAKSFINVEGAQYCSQGIALAFLKGVNIDPQVSPDRWKKTVGIVGRLFPTIRKKLDLGERIISPSGFMWQAELTEKVQIEYLDSLNYRKDIYSNNLNLLNPRSEFVLSSQGLIK